MSAFEIVRDHAIQANIDGEELSYLETVAESMTPLVQSFIQLSIGAHWAYFQYLKFIDPYTAVFVYNPPAQRDAP